MRTWTIAEANAALDDVRALLADARAAQAAVDEAAMQLEDLCIVYGAEAQQPGHAQHAEWQLWQQRHDAARLHLAATVAAFDTAAVSLKDITLGLVDFAGRVGRRMVWLCWREGEDAVRFWHPLDAGFTGRRAIPADEAQA